MNDKDTGLRFTDQEVDTILSTIVQLYLNDGGNHCPYCNSENIEGRHFEADSAGAWRSVICLACKNEWYDVYKLVDIDFFKAPPPEEITCPECLTEPPYHHPNCSQAEPPDDVPPGFYDDPRNRS